MRLRSGAHAGGRGSAQVTFQPALDGLRGIAVISVLVFHGGVSWAGGGFLGVEAFFVLSGFLITSLLLAEWRGSGGIRLGSFWARRARRLLPALFLVVAVVAIEQAIVGPSQAVPGFRADGVSTLLYYANWNQIIAGNGYFQQTALVSPLQHTWSLAIEEQFYLVWPLVVLGVMRRSRRRRQSAGVEDGGRAGLRGLLGIAVVGAVVSSILMAVLYDGGAGLNRVYYGTDTRAQGILTGATLAILLALRHRDPGSNVLPKLSTRASIGAMVAGLAGATGYVLACLQASGTSNWLYEGGFLALDLAVAGVIWSSLSIVRSPSPVRSVLSFLPLRGIGLISYGLYLWHFPLFLWLTTQSTGLEGAALFWLRIASTLAVSLVSYFVVEQPIRQRRVPALLTRALAPIGLAGALAAVLVASSVATAVPGAAKPLPLSSRDVALTGSGHTCKVQLPFLPPGTYQIFHTCPPKRVMVIGDSVALTLALQLGVGEQRYGILMANRGSIGCSFVTKGLLNVTGTFEPQYAPCHTQFRHWADDSNAFHPQAVVVEMGWWDSMDRQWSGKTVHIGQPAFDRYFLERAKALVHDVAPHGQPVIFLSVPWMNPAPWPDGESPPAASATRHREINRLLAEAAAQSHGQALLFDLGPYVSPSGHYQADIGGSICRSSDGIHFWTGPSIYHVVTTRCGEEVQKALFPYLRQLIKADHGRS